MKINSRKILDWTISVIGLLAVVFLIAFESKSGEAKRCTGIKVEVENAADQLFVTPNQVIDEITNQGLKPLEGKLLSQIDLCSIENEVNAIPQIQNCEVYGDLKGTIHITAKPYKPIARITKNYGKDLYMDSEGAFFPMSAYHTARVMLVSGSYFSNKKNNLSSQKDKEILSLIHSIQDSPFWTAQITQLDIDRSGNVSFIPLVGNQSVAFGKAENVDLKLKKLEVFYKKILPNEKWRNFTTVDIQYKNQIVCK